MRWTCRALTSHLCDRLQTMATNPQVNCMTYVDPVYTNPPDPQMVGLINRCGNWVECTVALKQADGTVTTSTYVFAPQFGLVWTRDQYTFTILDQHEVPAGTNPPPPPPPPAPPSNARNQRDSDGGGPVNPGDPFEGGWRYPL